MESNLKRISFENDGIDRISELPDSILCKILSFLPTKNAIGVKILSTRWKNISPFEFMPITLELDDTALFNPIEEDYPYTPTGSFMGFVDKLLNETLSHVPYVEKVFLKCRKNYGDDKIVDWVCSALRLNVRHLDLEFARNHSMTLFYNLNGCKTLVTLRLWIASYMYLPSPGLELDVPDHFSLPNLESLHLAKMTIGDRCTDPIEKLVKGCPALEYLSLVECGTPGGYEVFIESPLLKKLVVENCWEVYLSQLIIDAPNLEEFIYSTYLARHYDVCNFNSLRTAHIDIALGLHLLDQVEREKDNDEVPSYFDNVAMIVCRCSSTIHLDLSHCTIDVLNMSSMQLPVFQNLIWLSLGCLHWAVLARFLSVTSNLETLIIEEGFHENEGGFANFKNLLSFAPECLLLHLKRIEFWVFKGDEDEIKLVEYFLKNGEVLENIALRCLPLDDTSTSARLLMFPRRSKTCHIECTREQKKQVNDEHINCFCETNVTPA